MPRALLLDLLLLVHVGEGPEPADDVPVAVALREQIAEVPPVAADGAPEAALGAERLPRGDRAAPLLDEALDVVRVDHALPAEPQRLGRLRARVVRPALGEVRRLAPGIGGPDDLGDRLGEAPVAALGG